MILIVDNFDSFTYNLVDYFEQLGEECEVIRNDVHPEHIVKEKYSAMVFSPGPGKPEQAGFLMDYIDAYAKDIPMLGICLGHQAIAKFFGARVVKALRPMHGKVSTIELLQKDELFKGIENDFGVVRYHSLVVEGLDETLLKTLAVTTEGENMIFKHQFLPIYGIQYHPEAALTSYGKEILLNWKVIIDQKKEPKLNKL